MAFVPAASPFALRALSRTASVAPLRPSLPILQSRRCNTTPPFTPNRSTRTFRMQASTSTDGVGKVAIVTGSSRGIGKACALALADHGCDVVINYASSSEAAEQVVSTIQEKGRQSMAIKANIGNADEVTKLFKETMDKFGRVDIVVNNAGITRDGLAVRMKQKQWQDVIDVNLTGVFMCNQAAVKIMMKQRSGRIINIASIIGLMGNAGQVNYAAAKAGVIGITMTLAKECAPRGININAVAPGFIKSDMTASIPEEEVNKLIPLKRVGQPEEVAGLVRFLAVDAASAYITGHTFTIDGGMAIGS